MNDIKIPWPEWKAVKKLGNGSYGSVYEIEREDEFGHTEKAALKVISIPKEEDEIDYLIATGYDKKSITEYYRAGLKSIIDEYAIMARLKGHPNIVGCEDRRALRQENGVGWDVYIRMELLKPFLKDLNVKEKTEQDIIKLGKDLLNALKACHELNIIHRDIKPENIFVTKYGDYKLGDFGVARIMSHTTNATKTGTPYYMAPEVCKEEKYGKEADIYSLGMVLFWLLNNTRMPFEPNDRPPFGDEKERAYKERLSGKEIPEPLNGSPELKKVIKKALAYDPKDRYRSAEEMLSAIENIHNSTSKESKLKTDLDFKNIIEKVTRPRNNNSGKNKKEPPNSKTSAEHADYSETLGDSWGTSNKTIGASADGGRNKNSWIINDDNIADIEKTVGYESTVTPKSSSANNTYENNHRTDTEYESRKTYGADQNSKEYQNDKYKSTAGQDKKSDAWKRYLIFALIPLIIAFLILNSDAGFTTIPADNNTVLSAGDSYTVGLKKDGTLIATGQNDYKQCNISGWEDIISVSAGWSHTVGLKSDGTVVATGRNNKDQCNISSWKDITAISAGWAHTVGLKSNGTVVAKGYNSDGQCDVSGWFGWRKVTSVSAGWSHTVGLKSNGTVIATGLNNEGQCRVSNWKDITAISAGWAHTVGLKSDGTVVATGHNGYGQCDVSDWEDIIAISTGWSHTVGLKKDGTVVAVGDNNVSQCNVSDWKDIIAISAGWSHTVGLKKDGTVVAVGDNNVSQCNVSDWKDIKVDIGG